MEADKARKSLVAQNRRDRYKAEGRCADCGRLPLFEGTISCRKCILSTRLANRATQDQRIEQGRLLSQRRKVSAFNAYGGVLCVCCGEPQLEFLTLDHERRDGQQHRQQLKGKNFYRWLEQNNYPLDLGLRVLCVNCNYVRRYGHDCPHETDEGYEYDCSVGLLQHVSE